MTAALVAGLLAGLGIALPVGAVAGYLVALTARTSLRVGAAAALGVATADGLYALLAVVAGRAAADTLQPLTRPLRLVAAAVLLGLAAHGAVRGWQEFHGPPLRAQGTDQPSPLRAYLRLSGVTLLNPLTVVYFAALVAGGRSAVASSAGRGALFVVAAFVASAGWQLTLAGGGAALGRLLTGRRGRLFTALGSSLIIAGLAARLLVS